MDSFYSFNPEPDVPKTNPGEPDAMLAECQQEMVSHPTDTLGPWVTSNEDGEWFFPHDSGDLL